MVAKLMNFGRTGKTNDRFYGFRRYATDFITFFTSAASDLVIKYPV